MEGYSLLVVVASLVAGFIGGLLSRRIVLVSAAGAESAPVVPKVIRAERFEAVDKNGKTRARFAAAGLGFDDENGKTRVGLTDTGLGLFDENEDLHVGLGQIGLEFRDENGQPRVRFAAGGLEFIDKTGTQIRAMLAETGLEFCDQNSKSIFKAPPD